jgi:hypothetical protein
MQSSDGRTNGRFQFLVDHDIILTRETIRQPTTSVTGCMSTAKVSRNFDVMM